MEAAKRACRSDYLSSVIAKNKINTGINFILFYKGIVKFENTHHQRRRLRNRKTGIQTTRDALDSTSFVISSWQ